MNPDIFNAGLLLYIAGAFLAIALYLLPSFLATKHRNHGAILALNLLLGWTVIGWIVALVWSLTKEPTSVKA